MLKIVNPPATLAEVIERIGEMGLTPIQQRDMVSAINRLCDMAGVSPASTATEVPVLRQLLLGIRPARHDVSPKTFANLKSRFRAALELAGVIESMGRGEARRDPRWGLLLAAIGDDKRLSNGLAGYANWCVMNCVSPRAVTDAHVQRFLAWLETRTLCPRPCDIVCRIPRVWDDARERVSGWPQIELTPLSFRQPSEHLQWQDLDVGFREDAQAYLAGRENPDVFDERPNAPRRALAETTLRQQREHVRLAASILVRNGMRTDDITSLADLVEPDAFKIVLRHYHERAEGKPNAFAVGVAKTLQQVARYHVGVSAEALDRLKVLAAKLPSVPFDLTEKNQELLRQLESERMRARLVNLPLDLLADVRDGLDQGAFPVVDAQAAVAVDVALIAPARPKNLSRLHWRRHFHEPDGPKGRLLLRIPAEETKTRARELVFELPDDVANRLRWYRRRILRRLQADPNGYLFVSEGGGLKDQKTLASQIIGRVARKVGLHVTPHQFRHVAASFYLRAHPEDFRTVTDLLGHASAKTTLIYAGASSERASRVYTAHLLEQRNELKPKGRRRRDRKNRLKQGQTR